MTGSIGRNRNEGERASNCGIRTTEDKRVVDYVTKGWLDYVTKGWLDYVTKGWLDYVTKGWLDYVTSDKRVACLRDCYYVGRRCS